MSLVDFPKLSPLALELLEARYLMPGESVDELFWRVARHVAQAERLYDPEHETEHAEDFFRIMRGLLFLPNSPTLMNAGTSLGQLSACFVIPLEDSLEGIFGAVRDAALIQKTGGGVGYDFSPIRPKGDVVQSTQMAASGPMPFIKAFDAATDAVNQGGRRRGANMAVLRVDHPDIMDFIAAKRTDGLLSNFNLSVAVTDEFFRSLDEEGDFHLRNPRTGQVTEWMPAKKLMDAIVESAWECGEPGLLFIDRINEANPTPALGPIQATNPCGEQPLLPWESCNLGSVNLARMVKNGKVDWVRLAEVVRLAVRFLDDVIEVNRFPMPQIKQVTLANRKIGLGVMGFADLLIELRIPYDSRAAVAMADRVMGFVQAEAKRESSRLAGSRGSFSNFPQSTLAHSWPQMRNATVTSIAPTGSISLIAGCSQSIEPIFSLIQTRRFLEGRDTVLIHPAVTKEDNETLSYPLKDDVLKGKSTCAGESSAHLRSAHDISPEWQVKVVAAFQEHVDNGVSKTVNMPKNATQQEATRALLTARNFRCKGVTIFREGTKSGQIIERHLNSECRMANKNWEGCQICG